jgi:hypothetical protein
MMKTLDQLVSDKKILDGAKETAAEGELLEGHANMLSSVSRKSPYATDAIINYSKKKKNYVKEQKELNPPAAGAAAAAAAAGPLKPRTLANSDRLIRAFFKRKGVVENEKGVKFGGGKTLSFAFDDMMADLTKNVRKTNTNLTVGQHIKLLKEFKKINIPVGYIRSDNLRSQYRDLDLGTPQTQTPPPAYQTAPSGIINQQPPSFSGLTPRPTKSQKGRPRKFMFDEN